MERNFYFIGIAFFGMVNGLFNQVALLFALIHVQILAPALLFGSLSLTLLMSSLILLRHATLRHCRGWATGRVQHGQRCRVAARPTAISCRNVASESGT